MDTSRDTPDNPANAVVLLEDILEKPEVRRTNVGKLHHIVGVVAARKFVADYEQNRQWQYELALETYRP